MVLQAAQGIAGDEYRFVHRDHISMHLRTVGADPALVADHGVVADLVKDQSTPIHARTNAGSYLWGVFADAAAKL